MKKRTANKRFIIFILLCAAPLLAHAELYKRVDKNGNIEFSDKPFPGDDAETFEIKTQPKIGQDESVRRINERVDRLRESQAEKKKIDDTARQEKEKLLSKQKRACDNARYELRKFDGRVYTREENGERSYMTDEEMAHHSSKIKEWIKSNCKGV
ncbi:MAG: DUF4124 domain-containing protein [Alcanivoracaceae bacterium]|nr:DUF4124 domain-containing protein [Alcanivoracaceae bacterium]